MPALDLSVGAVEIGVLFSSVLFGILTVQAFLYTERKFRDPIYLRMMAGVVWLLETVHTLFIWILLYSLTVTNYGNYSAITDTSWPLAAAPPLTSFLGSMVQVFFADKVRALSGSMIVPVISWIGAIVRCIGGITLGIVLSNSHTIPNFFAHYQWLVTAQFILSAFIDVLNTSTLCFYLLRQRTDVKATQHLVDKLVMYTVETGLITSLCGIAIVILSLVMPHTLTDFGLFMVYPKLFSNSLFTSLNARHSLRQRDVDPLAAHVRSNLVFTQPRPENEDMADGLPLTPSESDVSHSSVPLHTLPWSSNLQDSSTKIPTNSQ